MTHLFDPRTIPMAQWDDFINEVNSFNFRMSLHNINLDLLESQWSSIVPLLLPVLEWVEQVVYDEPDEEGETQEVSMTSPGLSQEDNSVEPFISILPPSTTTCPAPTQHPPPPVD